LERRRERESVSVERVDRWILLLLCLSLSFSLSPSL